MSAHNTCDVYLHYSTATLGDQSRAIYLDYDLHPGGGALLLGDRGADLRSLLDKLKTEIERIAMNRKKDIRYVLRNGQDESTELKQRLGAATRNSALEPELFSGLTAGLIQSQPNLSIVVEN